MIKWLINLVKKAGELYNEYEDHPVVDKVKEEVEKKFKLKGGASTNDKRLDRVELFDEKSKDFPITAIIPKNRPLRSYTWRCRKHLNQGMEGACVGFGICHELAARPAEVQGLTNRYAREKIYWEAQKIDRFPGGAYPGAERFMEGTAVLAGVKIAQELGYFDSYRWAFGLEDLQIGVGYNGPAVMGLRWYEGMHETDADGYIHPTGRCVGGHCILCTAVDTKRERFTLHNSWGKRWGREGRCYISFEDMDTLLKQRGEAVFFIKRHNSPKKVIR